ncbi:MAG: GDSL-type esterase/lipase family protein, partial [Solirubrobacteraceae bacterium]
MSGGVGRGLVALGDSITKGEGQAMLGQRCLSWAQWLAMALELPYTGLAVNGAMAAAALAEQVPRLRGPYDLGCVYLGVNDVRYPDFDADAFRDALAGVLDGVAAEAPRASTAARLLVVTIPLDLGRPPVPAARIAGTNRAIAELAAARDGVAVLDLSDLGGWRYVLPDAVHLTAAGQLHVAERAARVLGAPAPPEEAATG